MGIKYFYGTARDERPERANPETWLDADDEY